MSKITEITDVKTTNVETTEIVDIINSKNREIVNSHKLNGMCSICFKPIKNTNKTKLSCKHKFHSTCIIRWSKNTPKNRPDCPMCRAYLYPDGTYPDGTNNVSFINSLMKFAFNNITICVRGQKIEYIYKNIHTFLRDHLFEYLDIIKFKSKFSDEYCIKLSDKICASYKLYEQLNKIILQKSFIQDPTIEYKHRQYYVHFNPKCITPIESRPIKIPKYSQKVNIFLIYSGNKIIPLIFYDCDGKTKIGKLNYAGFLNTRIIDITPTFMKQTPRGMTAKNYKVLGISRDHKFIYIYSGFSYYKLSLNKNKITIVEKIEFLNIDSNRIAFECL